MKIVQVNATYNIGSTGLIVHDIGETLIKHGYEVFYAYQYASPSPKNGIKVGSKIDWKLHAFFCRLFGGQGFYSKLSTILLVRKLEKIKPDIVHLHNLHSNFINLEILLDFLARKNIATVVTMHDCWFFTGKCFHFVDVNCDRFISSCGSCPKRMAPPKSICVDRSSKDLALKEKLFQNIPRLSVVGCSKWISNEAQKGFMKNLNVSCIYNGVDTNIFRLKSTKLRKTYGILDSDFVVLGMANKWMQERNIGVLKKLLVYNLRIVILGCSANDKKRLNAISPGIVSVGFVSGRELLAEFYNMANVFVNLTHADTLPTVNMESICCGTPVVTYDVGGSPELVDSKTGIIVKEDDEDGIVHAVLQIQKKPLLQCGEVGIAKFNKEVCYLQYLNIYNNLYKNKH